MLELRRVVPVEDGLELSRQDAPLESVAGQADLSGLRLPVQHFRGAGSARETPHGRLLARQRLVRPDVRPEQFQFLVERTDHEQIKKLRVPALLQGVQCQARAAAAQQKAPRRELCLKVPRVRGVQQGVLPEEPPAVAPATAHGPRREEPKAD